MAAGSRGSMRREEFDKAMSRTERIGFEDLHFDGGSASLVHDGTTFFADADGTTGISGNSWDARAKYRIISSPEEYDVEFRMDGKRFRFSEALSNEEMPLPQDCVILLTAAVVMANIEIVHGNEECAVGFPEWAFWTLDD